ncbi:MAG: cytosine permease [Gemmatimonadaceae bacterium]|nr:cytosine permease [Gemmatimonadaceae bacterium]
MPISQVPSTTSEPSGIEHRSIDWIPDAERHGVVSDLGAIWFVGNINLTAMATGATALSIGAGLMWTVIATVIGSLFGTFFMAFHSAQGPQLGLPQLVQSRAQFGYVGAALTVYVFALINYFAYNTSDAILSGDAMHALFGLSVNTGYLLAAGGAALITLYGYHWIHRVNRWLMWPLVLVLVVITVAALTDSRLPADAFVLGPFKPAAFTTVFVIVGGFQLGWAPYVSDYSRYLPATVGVRPTFWWTYLPSAVSAIWVFALGATVSAAGGADATIVQAIRSGADRLYPGLGWFALVALLCGVISVMALNQYGGMMSIIAIRDAIKPVTPSRRLRVGGVLLMAGAVWSGARFVGVERFTEFYANVLIYITYLFTPWTAINLVDYFFVRRGVYVLGEMFKPDGIYGRWGWRGNAAYLVTLAAMVPFMVTTPYTGVAAARLGGVDLSIFVGLPLAGGVYWGLCRGLDVGRERRLAEAERVLLADG